MRDTAGEGEGVNNQRKVKRAWPGLVVLLVVMVCLWFSAPAAADVIIAEMCDPKFNITSDRYIEIYNTGSCPVDLTGWKLYAIGDGNTSYITFNLSGTIQPGEALTAGSTTCTFTTHAFPTASAWTKWDGGTNDGARLVNSAAVTVDQCLGVKFSDSAIVRKAWVGDDTTVYIAGNWTLTTLDYSSAAPATPGTHACQYPRAKLYMTNVDSGPLRHGTSDSNTLYAGRLDTGPRLIGVVINKAAGTADHSDVPYLALWRDVDCDSTWSAGDVSVGTIPWDAARQCYRMTGATWDQTAFAPWNFVITAGLADTAVLTDGQTFKIELRSDSGFKIDYDPGTTADDTWTPYLSATQTNANLKTINTRISTAELNIVKQAAGYIRYNSSNNLIMAFTIPDNGGCTYTLNDVRLTHAGTLTPATDYTLALWQDMDDNGNFDPHTSDAAGSYPLTWNGGSSRWEDNGGNLEIAIPPGGQRFFIVVTPTAGAAHNETLILTLPDPCFTLDPDINDMDAAVSSNQFTYQSRVASFSVSVPSDTPVNGAFTLTITARDLLGAVYTDFTATVDLSVDSGTIAPAQSNRFTAGVLNQTFTINTVGDSNVIRVTYHPDTPVIIAEVNSCTAANASYVELYNQSAVTQNLTGYKLYYYDNGAGAPTATQNLAGSLVPGAYLIIARKPGDFDATYGFACDFDENNMKLDGGLDAVGLYDGSKVADRFNKVPATAAWTDNHLFERVSLPNRGDSLAAHWSDIGLDRLGTPKAANANVIPLASAMTGTAVISITPQSGFGTAVIIQPAGAFAHAGDSQQTVGIVMQGSSIWPVMDTISITIPALMSWAAAVANVTCSGPGFTGSQMVTLTGSGSAADSYIVTIYGSMITSSETGLVTINWLNFDGGTGKHVANCIQSVTIKTAQDKYIPAAVANAPAFSVLIPMTAIKISEVGHSYTGQSKDEFIELYNTLSCSVSISGWRLRYGNATTNLRSSAGILLTTLGVTAVIQGRGYYLIADVNDYTGLVPADATWDGDNMLATGGHVAIDTGATAGIADLFGWGSAAYPEVDAFADIPVDREAASMVRKANAFATAESMLTGADRFAGNGFDSNNNYNDFVKTAGRDPQNSRSAPEPSFDGYGSISPTNRVAKSGRGEWTITYRAGTDSFANGRVDFVIPTGWTAPQNTVATNPGYIGVSAIDGTLGAVSIAGQTIQVPVTALLATTGEINVIYGHTGGGVNWGALAVARATTGTDTFVVKSDNDGVSTVNLKTASPQLTTVNVNSVTFIPAINPRNFVGATYLLTAISKSGSDSVYGTKVNFAITGDGSDSYLLEAAGYRYLAGSTLTSITGYTDSNGKAAVVFKVGSYNTCTHTVTVNDQSTPTGPYKYYDTTRLGFPVISEVGWSGFVNEYVEIYNPTMDTLSFTDSSFHFGDKDGVNTIASNAALAGKVIGPHRYLLIEDAELATPAPADYLNGAMDLFDAPPGDSFIAYYDSRTVNEIVDAPYTGIWYAGGNIGGYQVAMERIWIDRSARAAVCWANGDSIFPMNGETGKGSPGLPNQSALYASTVRAATIFSNADSVAITVTLLLNSGDTQPGHRVAITNANSQHGCSQPIGVTDENGIAIGYAQGNSGNGTSTVSVTYPRGVTETATVIFDYTPPAIHDEVHSNISDTSGETPLTVAIQVTDTVSGLVAFYPKIRYAWSSTGMYGNWQNMELVAGDSYAYAIPEVWDEHSGETLNWQVLLLDQANNFDTITYAEYIDTSPPLQVNILFPADTHDTIVGVIRVTGTTFATAAGDTVYLFINSNASAETVIVIAAANGDWSGTAALSGYDSTVIVTAQLLDRYGRTRYDSITVIYIPNLAPPIVIMVPVDGETYTGNVTITYCIYDIDNNACTVTVQYSADNGVTWQDATISSGSVNGVAADADGETYAIVWASGTDLPDTTSCQILVRMFAYDGRDTGAADTTGAIGIDQQPPASPTGLSATADMVADPDIGIWLAWNSVGGDTLGYHVYVDTDGNGFAQRLTSSPVTDTTEYFVEESFLTLSCTYVFYVTCIDAVGNESLPSETAAAMFDITPPLLYGISRTDICDTSGPIPLTVTVSVSDTLSGLAAGYPKIRYAWESTGIFGAWLAMTPAGGTTYTCDTSAVWFDHGGETLTVQFTATDNSGNGDTITYGEYIELTPWPTIGITFPATNHDTNIMVVTVTGTTAVTTAGDTVFLYVNSTDSAETCIVLAAANGTWSGTVALTGNDAVIAYVYDRYARYGEAGIAVNYLSNVGPLLDIRAPVAGETYTGNVTCTFVVADSTADACTVWFTYSTDSGVTWLSPTIVGNLAGISSSATGETHAVIWQTGTDYSGMSSRILLRASVCDALDTGTGDTTACFGIDNLAPEAPTGLTATADTAVPDTGVWLVWNSVPGDTLGYHVYVDTDGNGFAQRLTLMPLTDTTGYRAVAVTLGETYVFHVTCVDTYGNESLASATATAPMLLPYKYQDTVSLGGMPILPRPGARVAWRIGAHNNGFGPAQNVVISDAITSDLKYLPGTADTVAARGYQAVIDYSHDSGVSWDSSQAAPVTNVRWTITGGQSTGSSVEVKLETLIR